MVVVAASTLESARLLLLSKSSQHPNGIGNSSGHVGHNFCEHLMGPGVSGLLKDLVGKPRTNDDGKPGGFYLARFRNLHKKQSKEDKQRGFIRGYGFEGGSGVGMGSGAGTANRLPGFGKAWKKRVRDEAGATIGMGGFGEVLPRYENHVRSTPRSRTAGASPCCASTSSSGRTRRRWRRTWRPPPGRCSRRPASRSSTAAGGHPPGGLVDPRARHRPHGVRSQDLGAQPATSSRTT